MKIFLLLAGVVALFSTNARANTLDIEPYVGLDYVYSMSDIDKVDGYNVFEEDLNAMAVSVGAKFHKNFGLEASYQESEEGEKTVLGAVRGKDSYKAYSLDLIGYIPVVERVELLGTLGVGHYDVDAKLKNIQTGYSVKDGSNGVGYRIGAGAMYNFTNNIGARFIIRYVDTDIDGLDNMVDLTVGLRYTF